MPSVFGQFCPVALASEVLMQKWMLLILREMNAGSTRFNDIRRGVPRISATLLKQRLDQLERADIVFRRPVADGGTAASICRNCPPGAPCWKLPSPMPRRTSAFSGSCATGSAPRCA